MSDEAAKRLKFWAQLIGFVLGCGFGSAMYLNNYAKAADLRSVTKKLDEHIEATGPVIGGLQVSVRNIEEDYHWQRDQLQKIADTVGAPRVATPKH